MDKLTPQELRCGNLVEYKGQHVPILKIDSMNELVDAGKLIYKGSVTVPEYSPPNGRIWNYNSPWIYKIKPIPLTDEYLEKVGFVKHEESVFKNIQMKYWAKDAVILFFNESPPDNTYLLGFGFNDIDQNYYAATMCWINSVHELQNAYYSMKQKELTISEPTKQSEE